MVLAPFWKSPVRSVALAVRNPCTTARLGSASGLSLHLWRIGELGMFHPASELCQPVPGMNDDRAMLA